METILVQMLGGFGLFLTGMYMMRRGIEKVLGNKLRSMLRNFSKSKFLGLIGGLFFTAVMQSSSESTTMVVEFVNSELMTLAEATGIILGANIGTTITAFLVSLRLSVIAPFFLIFGALTVHFMKKTVSRQTGEIILGFGILFYGIGTLSSSIDALQQIPKVAYFFASLTNPFLGFLLGMTVTAILQSSAVTISILVILSSQGLLSLPICTFIILGCNIGSCWTALFTALDGSKNAKRAAFIHLLLNVFGSVIITICLLLFSGEIGQLIYFISGYDSKVIHMGRCIACAHLLFKVFQVVILYPFTGFISKLTYQLIPGEEIEDDDSEFHLEFIDPVTLPNPTIAILSAVQEMERMAFMAMDNLNLALDCLLLRDEKKMEQVYETEKYLNFLSRSINNYLIKINQDTLPLGDAKMISAYFHVINDIERIGDHSENFVEMVPVFNGDEMDFNEENIMELKEMMDVVNQLMKKSIRIFVTGKTDQIEEVQVLEDQIDSMDRNFEAKQIRRVNKGTCTPEAAIHFSDVLSGLEQVADHAMNIAFALIEAKKAD